MSLKLFIERAAPWRNLILICGVGLPVAILSRISAARPALAVVLAFVLPVVVVAIALMALRDSRHRALITIFGVVAGFSLGITEFEVSESFFPGDPFGSAELSPGSSAQLRALRSEARGRFEVELRRGAQTQTVTGELSRRVTSSRAMMRRGAPTSTLVLHDADVQEVSLRGSGPVTAHLVSVGDALNGGVRVALGKASGADRVLLYALAALAVIALLLELFAARLNHRTALAGSVAILGVFAYHVTHRFNPSDPLPTVMGGVVFALLTGGVGGWLLGLLGVSMLKRSAPPPEKKV